MTDQHKETGYYTNPPTRKEREEKVYKAARTVKNIELAKERAILVEKYNALGEQEK